MNSLKDLIPNSMQQFYNKKGFRLNTYLRYFYLLPLFLIGSFASAQSNSPEINIQQGGTNILTGETYTFNNQNVNTSSAAVTFTIQNSGIANLNISGISLTGTDANQFTLSGSASPLVIAPGETSSFTVSFSPKNNVPSSKNANITIVNDDEDEGTYTINVTGTAVILPATISSLAPTAGAAIGATATINGTNLINTTSVVFNGVLATSFTIVSNSRITAIVPAGATSGPISVTNGAGTVISSQTFFVIPSISSLNPNTGAVGSLITITGSSFTGATSVKFNGIEAQFTVNSSIEIVATVPAGVTIGRVTVTTPSGTGTSSQIFYPTPTITSIIGQSGSSSGIIGDVITINGTNFPNLTSTVVKFTGKNGVNTITATRTYISTTQLTAVIPVGAITGPVTVTTVAGTASAEFTINNTSYTWNKASGNWSEPSNWTPSRTSPTSKDVLMFDGSVTANANVTLDFASSETIGYLSVTNNASVTFTVAEDKTLNIDNNVAPGADFVVAGGSSLTVTNSIAGADLMINITSGETGTIAGTVTFQGVGSSEHRLLASANSLVALNGGRFIASSNLVGSPFGATPKSAVVFSSGATYINRSGGSPFGASGSNAVVVFNAGSTYTHEVNSAPDLIDRAYGNFIISNQAGATIAFNQTVSGTGNLIIRNNFTQTVPSGVPAPTFNINLVGDISLAGNLSVNSGSLNFNPASASTISVGANIIFANNSNLTFDNSSAITTVKLTGINRSISGAGTILIGNKANLSIETGASITISKNVIGTGSVTVGGKVITSNVNGLLGGASTSLVNTLQTVTLNPGSTVEYTGTGAQTISATDYANLIISGARNFKTVSLPNLLRVSAGFSPIATNVVYNTTNNTFVFDGANQNIPAFNYNNITIAGTGNKSLAANVTVNGNLDFVANKLITGNNTLTLGSSAIITGEETGKYVVGTLKTTRMVGTSGSAFGGMGITLGSGVDVGEVTVIRNSGPGASVKVNEWQGINRSWDVQPTIQPATPINVSLSWVADDDNGKDLNLMRVWKTIGNDLSKYYDVSKTDLDASNRTITASVSSFSIITVSDQNNPLPVELISFSILKKGSNAVLSWKTASEKNNLGFAVEVSTDAKRFKEVAFVKSINSNSNITQNYEFTHRSVSSGTVYYRLKQTDWDGTSKYFGPKAVRFDHPVANLLVYPNPVTEADKEVVVVINGTINEKAIITITDALGRAIYHGTEAIVPAYNELKINLRSRPAGVYLMNITTHTGTTQTKIVKQ